MVQSPENRSRNGHVLVWDQPGLNDPNHVPKPESKYLPSLTLLSLAGCLAHYDGDDDRVIRQPVDDIDSPGCVLKQNSCC